MLHLIFYVFAAIAIGFAVAAITARNPVRSVLSLVVTFFAMAGVWMLLRAEFLSLTLILVYVGAVMTLFLFVVMMLNIDKAAEKNGFVRYLPFAAALSILLLGMLMIALGPKYFGLTQMPAPLAEPADYSNIQQLGSLLFTHYVYPFEVAGVILLAAIIAAITLAHKAPTRRRVQDPGIQVQVDPKDRVRLVNMPAEPREGSAS